MGARITIERVGPMASVQDPGRFGCLEHGISASGPMDADAFLQSGDLVGFPGTSGIEFSMTGLDLVLSDGELEMGWAGGAFTVAVNGETLDWPGRARLKTGERLTISAGSRGNWGYLRFGGEVDVPLVMGSRATSLRARIGGLEGRALAAGDVLGILGGTREGTHGLARWGRERRAAPPEEVLDDGPIRFIWGLHADAFSLELRQAFVTSRFRISSMMDRMGVRLRDEARVFERAKILSLVSDPVICGDIQILGDGTPIVLGRDHQPTGGYPRIGTVITADLDRFFQKRPNEAVAFVPVGLDHAQALLRGGTS